MTSNPNKVAILLLTCDKYLKAAELTLSMLQYHWKEPPEIFVCGLSKDLPGESVIPFSVDSRDWMGIAHQAASCLQSCGYEYCYLVLDDHPPVGVCNGDYLKNDLPALVRRLNATVVSMVGWDQIRAYKGIRLNGDQHYWLRNDIAYRWIFNLHPGCWDIAALMDILKIVMSSEVLDHSARTFEASAGSLDTLIPEKYRRSSYRVCGEKFVVDTKWFSRPLVRKGMLQALHAVRLSVKTLGGENFLSKADARAKLYTDYLNGPYPMFWSGLMQRGKVHDNAVRFLRLAGLDEYADIASKL